mgnify:CR=1 FL=1
MSYLKSEVIKYSKKLNITNLSALRSGNISVRAKEKGIDRDLLLTILEDVFRTMIRKKYETDDAFSVILNADRGEIQILHVQEVVPAEELADPVGEIALEDAQKIDPDIELYDELAQEVNILDFGRRAVNMARQQLAQRIREIEKDNMWLVSSHQMEG